MKFNFPEIKTKRNIAQRCDKVLDELVEFLDETDPDKKDIEAIDVLHTVESLLLEHFKGRKCVIDKLIKKVYNKNNARGYYTKECF